MQHRHLLVLLVAGLLLAGAAPARAQAPNRPAIGIGEQDPNAFQSPRFAELGLRQAHHLEGWDMLQVLWQRDRTDAFVREAQARGVDVLMAFGVSAKPRRRHVAPTPAQYKRQFSLFRARYPSVRDFVIWNEANHCSQPVCHRPALVAAYLRAARRVCRTCRFVGADVLDSSSMRWWVTSFERALGRTRVDAWGMHNYVDANRRQTTNTRWLLRNVRGPVWFTETGGLVKRRSTSPIKFPQGLRHAERTTRFLLNHLGALSPRIDRIYLYHFVNQGTDQSWDSGLLNPHGSPRPAYRVLERWLRKAGRLPGQRPAT